MTEQLHPPYPFVSLNECQDRQEELSETVQHIQHRLGKLESITDKHENRLTRVETILENQAKLVNDMAQIQRDEMKWARNEISNARKNASNTYLTSLKALLNIIGIAVILALGGKISGLI